MVDEKSANILNRITSEEISNYIKTQIGEIYKDLDDPSKLNKNTYPYELVTITYEEGEDKNGTR